MPCPRRTGAVMAALLPFVLAAPPVLAQPGPGAEGSSASMVAQALARSRAHLRDIASAVPGIPAELAQVADTISREASLAALATGVLAALLVGVVAEVLFRRATAGPRQRRAAVPIERLNDRLIRVGMDLLLDVASVLIFALAAAIGLAVVGFPPRLHEVCVALLTALVYSRLAAAVLGVLLRPAPGPDRAFACFDLDERRAGFWYRRLVAFVAWFAGGWGLIGALRVMGMPRDGLLVLAYLLGIGLVALAIAMIWHPRERTEEETPSPKGVTAGNAGPWLATVLAVLFWLVWTVGAMPLFWFMTAAVGLPLSIGAARRGARHLLRPVPNPDGTPGVPSVVAVLAEQGLRAVLIVGAVGLLLWGWGLDVGALAGQETTFTRLLRGSLHALIIVLMADLGWGVIRALSDNALARAEAAPGLDAEETRRRARIRTLLPIGRNIAAIVLVVMAALMALSALGVEIAPLIASAGVVGVAVGFGAQTVVRDMISGMFYMLDDAFRVGEYIQSGSYKGTVESFSLRSVKLRHQRGPLFTIPFGVLGAVQNMSRDWVIVKDKIGITYDSDVDKAKKLIKQIGLELSRDPDLAPNILQPLKMQGIEEFGEYAINIRTKMMTKPGEQFVIRRRANAMIKKAFDENGIHFAFPTVQLAGGNGGNNDAAVAAAAQSVLKPEPPVTP